METRVKCGWGMGGGGEKAEMVWICFRKGCGTAREGQDAVLRLVLNLRRLGEARWGA